MKFFKSIFAAFVFCVCVCAGAFAECASGEYIDPDNAESCLSCPSGGDGSDAGCNAQTCCFHTCSTKSISNAASVNLIDEKEYYNGTVYPDCEYTVVCNSGYSASGNGTVNPECNPNTINLVWANGGHGTVPSSAPSSCTYDGTFDMPYAMTATGYTFNKWEVNNTGFSAGASVSCDNTDLGVYSGSVTITGLWNINNHNVTLVKGTGIESVSGAGTYNYNASVSINAQLKAGYDWSKWTNSSGGGLVSNSQSYTFNMPDNNVSYTANATLHTYTISYDLNDISDSQNPSHGTTHFGTYNIEQTITISNPTMNGYNFNGWEVTTAPIQWGSGSSQSGDSNFKIATGTYGNIELKAKWKIINYSISYELNDGTNYVSAPTSYNVDTSEITLGIPVREGYEFAGWYDNSNFTGNAITTIPTGSTGNKTFYAKWVTCEETKYCPANREPEQCPTNYPNSAAGSTSVNDCYLTLAEGKYVETAKHGMQDCETGNYCPGYYLKETCVWNEENNSGHWPDSQDSCSKDATRTYSNIYYDEIGGIFLCEAGSFQPATGQKECNACSAGYTTEGAGSKSASDCKFIPKFCYNAGSSCFSFPTTITVKNKM